ncbi:endonuclease/exonuclease/phosphatase family protein [Bernardetia sp. Wsw4-3y2]|uniref:endonuclease/exonuclease/phosphatase family protein n=1 Tax=Bernardetia sp. Wsw4-3y2 TaxID=3127471 RepID=UPI0030D5068E
MFKKRILVIIPFLFFCASFLSLFPFWLGDLFSHFRMLWTVLSFILLVACGIFVIQKKIDMLFLVFPFAALLINWYNSPQFSYNSYSLWKNFQTYEYLYSGSPTDIEYSENLKREIKNDTTVKSLLLMNVLSSNRNYEEVKETIKNTDADFVVIIELNQKWKEELNEIEQNYFAHYSQLREDNFGMGIYSKTSFVESILLDSVHNQKKAKQANSYSMTNPNINYYISNQKLKEPCIYVQDVNQTAILIAHSFPPISPEAYDRRNNYLREISSVAAKKEKTLLVGDFNCSPFSADYKKFLKNSGLKDSQENFGFQPTWNSSFPFLMQTQLDHVWHSEDIEILHRQTLPIEGSDHKAVLVLFR